MEYDVINNTTQDAVELLLTAHALFGKNGTSAETFFLNLANRLKAVSTHYAKRQLTILIGGEVSSGKSTFINTLIGKNVLPTAQETCTNVATKISYGEDKVVVHFNSDNGTSRQPLEISPDKMIDYSTETNNPKNELGVEHIEVFTQSPLLESGLVFIDTPGLGAVDPKHAIVTFSIATQADMIIFLGSVLKPITTSEVQSLENLTKVVKDAKVLHIVSRADQGDKDVIKEQNVKIIKQELPNLEFDALAVSSALYNSYHETGDKYDLEDSGFQDVLSYIDKLNASMDDILNKRYAMSVFPVIAAGFLKLKELLLLQEDPAIKQGKIDTLNRLLARLTEIQDKTSEWKRTLGSKITKYSVQLNKFCDNEFSEAVKKLDAKLERPDEFFLKKKNVECLCNSITANLVSFQGRLTQEMLRGYANIYEELRSETGLKLIQEQSIAIPDKVTANVDINEDKVAGTSFGEQLGDVYRAGIIGLGVGIGAGALTTFAGAGLALAGAKLGALLGLSIPIPVIGPAIGGAMGLILGSLAALASLLKSKESRKKQKIQGIRSVCVPQIQSVFSDVKHQLELKKCDNINELWSVFEKELQATIKKIKELRNNITGELDVVRGHYNEIKSLRDTCKEYVKTLNPQQANT